MIVEPMYRRIINDEALTRGLGDIEARMLVEWLVDWAELLEETIPDVGDANQKIGQLQKKARAISKFVVLWSDGHSKAGALQLAATERFQFPIPEEKCEADEAMARILKWENDHLAQF
ncbi:hypothetical protein KIH39_10750 [Telmatocola sphagniphila]|uniref:Uncharacterized protein n=1 Tax=Telmatocola sphagniphila TaxID=1123043 RepID=A0A8E6BAW3_9BACT|nr:hypothetical protein [Telmatocola sphagniphila]QVL34356.1 hypothetical protein KIH39_10750 [Telmatocola sphagniphila]